MSQALQNQVKRLEARVAELESNLSKATGVTAGIFEDMAKWVDKVDARLDALESKRKPGRPKKDETE